MKFLVAEDEFISQSIIAGVLNNIFNDKEVIIEIVTTVEEYREKLLNDRYDGILVDIQLDNGGDAYEETLKLLHTYPEIADYPVMFLTGDTSSQKKDLAMDNDWEWENKPISKSAGIRLKRFIQQKNQIKAEFDDTSHSDDNCPVSIGHGIKFDKRLGKFVIEQTRTGKIQEVIVNDSRDIKLIEALISTYPALVSVNEIRKLYSTIENPISDAAARRRITRLFEKLGKSHKNPNTAIVDYVRLRGYRLTEKPKKIPSHTE